MTCLWFSFPQGDLFVADGDCGVNVYSTGVAKSIHGENCARVDQQLSKIWLQLWVHFMRDEDQPD